MAALTGPRMLRTETIKSRTLVLAASTAVYRGGMACVDTTNHVVTKGAVSTTLIPVGTFEADVDNSANTGTSFVWVTLSHEIEAIWFDNDTGSNAVTASGDLYGNVYVLDDHTVSHSSGGSARSIAGRVWDIDASRGVLVQLNQWA